MVKFGVMCSCKSPILFVFLLLLLFCHSVFYKIKNWAQQSVPKQKHFSNLTVYTISSCLPHSFLTDLSCCPWRCSRTVTGKDPGTQSPRLTPWWAKSTGTQPHINITHIKSLLMNHCVTHLQDEHILSEVIPIFKYDAYGIFTERGGVCPFKLQPQWLLLRCHHFALLNLNTDKRSFHIM